MGEHRGAPAGSCRQPPPAKGGVPAPGRVTGALSPRGDPARPTAEPLRRRFEASRMLLSLLEPAEGSRRKLINAPRPPPAAGSGSESARCGLRFTPPGSIRGHPSPSVVAVGGGGFERSLELGAAGEEEADPACDHTGTQQEGVRARGALAPEPGHVWHPDLRVPPSRTARKKNSRSEATSLSSLFWHPELINCHLIFSKFLPA